MHNTLCKMMLSPRHGIIIRIITTNLNIRPNNIRPNTLLDNTRLHTKSNTSLSVSISVRARPVVDPQSPRAKR